MKTIIRVLFLILIMSLLNQCKNEPESKVTINDVHFLKALIELGVDTDGNGIISPAEAGLVTSLTITGDSISDITGIEAFINLHKLECDYNQLSSLNVSNIVSLEKLSCHWNQLTTLDVSKNTALNFLDCGVNKLTSLNVSNNSALDSLKCYGNRLTTIDFTKNTNLRLLICAYNQFTDINVSKNSVLRQLSCDANQLTTLDVTNNTSLEYLSCSYNFLTSLNISKNTAIRQLYLTSIPTLYKVCVWTMPFPPQGLTITIYKTDSPNIYFTASCD